MFWFVDCDIDGAGKRWRLASRANNTFHFLESDFSELVGVFDETGCRYVGPFTALNLLMCVEVAENVKTFETLTQDEPGVSRVDAAVANSMITASLVADRNLHHQRHNWD